MKINKICIIIILCLLLLSGCGFNSPFAQDNTDDLINSAQKESNDYYQQEEVAIEDAISENSYEAQSQLSLVSYPEWVFLSENYFDTEKIYSPIDHDYNLKSSQQDFIGDAANEFRFTWAAELDFQCNELLQILPAEQKAKFMKQQSAWQEYLDNDYFSSVVEDYQMGYGYTREYMLIAMDRIRTRTLEVLRIRYLLRESDDPLPDFYYSTPAKPLEIEDFFVSDGKNTIILDFPYIDFDIDMIEEEIENSYVGELYAGEFAYKVFFHKYADFDLYTSNTNYNTKNRGFDEYYITQISLKTPVYKTYRGIAIGASAEDLINTYGSGKELSDGENMVIVYSLKDMEMQFTVNDNTINGIDFVVIVAD